MGAPFSASAIFRAVDIVSAPIRRMESSVKGFKKTIESVRSSLIGLAGGLSLAAVVYTGAHAITTFDESLASLKSITGVTGKAFEPFKKQIFEVGDITKKSYVDVAKAMELIGSAKPELLNNAAAMGQMTKATILLSKASGMDLETSSGALTKALNQFGAGAEQAAKFVDILSTSEQKGTATTPQIVEALLNGGSAAKTLGLSFEETNAIIQAYAKAGVIGSEAGTQMAAVLSKMAQSQNSQYNPAVVGATKAINNLAKAHLSYKALIQMFGPEAAKFMATLLNQNSVVQSLSGNLYDVGNAQKQSAERSRAFNVRVEELISKFKNLAIKGNETSGTLNLLGGILGLITNNLGLIIGVVGSAIVAYGAYWAVMKTGLAIQTAYNVGLGIWAAFQSSVPIQLGANATALAAYNIGIKAISIATGIWTGIQWALTAATTAFSAALQSTGIPLIILAISALVAGIVLLIKNFDKVKAAVVDFAKGAIDSIKTFGKAILSFILWPLEIIVKAIGKITGADWAKNMGNSIGEFRQKLSVESDNKEKPVNKDAAVLTQKKVLETNKNQNVQININDSTGKASVSGQLQPIPIYVRNTKGGF